MIVLLNCHQDWVFMNSFLQGATVCQILPLNISVKEQSLSSWVQKALLTALWEQHGSDRGQYVGKEAPTMKMRAGRKKSRGLFVLDNPLECVQTGNVWLE